ncbi:IS701 family transposase [Streptomyces flavidovirens]|uniref:IS701 family transposase n=1 Tax=Streptomyces flavidovirens TaxID=67298 RepID=UPI00369AD63A
MTHVYVHDAHAVHDIPIPLRSASRDVILAELASRVFTSLTRSDQRRKGIQYLNGLLEIQGRKSIRNIAALLGEQVSEQNLHHFICDSTWDWVPIRRALAGALLPEAWVVRPVIIPKAGQHSVGVDRHFSRTLGQTVNAQRAVGVWAASEHLSAPVNWRLHLPPSWLMDDSRRSQAAIPDGMNAETMEECSVEAALETAMGWGLPVRPTVLDLDEAHAPLLERLTTTRTPLLARVGPNTPLTVTDPVVPGRGQGIRTAHEIMVMAKNMRRPVSGRRHAPEPVGRRALAAAVRVGFPARPARLTGNSPVSERRGLVLVGMGEDGGRWPAELWLSNLTTVPTDYLVRLRRLADRVDHDALGIAGRVGIRDFTGRSFNGWHRHITLASIAHAVVALAGNAHGPQPTRHQLPHASSRS